MAAVTDTLTTTTFVPELWSDAASAALAKNIDASIIGSLLPIRSRGAQLLRDFALGKPEYGPDPGDGPPEVASWFNIDGTTSTSTDMTWTTATQGTITDSTGMITISAGDTVTLTNFTITATTA